MTPPEVRLLYQHALRHAEMNSHRPQIVTFIFKPEMKIKLIGEGVELKNIGKQVIQ